MAKKTDRASKKNMYDRAESIDTTIPLLSTEYSVADEILLFWPVLVFIIAAAAAFFFAPEIALFGVAVYVWGLLIAAGTALVRFVKRKKH